MKLSVRLACIIHSMQGAKTFVVEGGKVTLMQGLGVMQGPVHDCSIACIVVRLNPEW